jgi:NAD(P)H-flavin reductase
VRAGGAFTWPPVNSTNAPELRPEAIERLVLIAGGVGINPLMSIFASLIHAHRVHDAPRPREIHFLYGTKASESREARERIELRERRSPSASPVRIESSKILFLHRLMDLVSMAAEPTKVTLSLFLTDTTYPEGAKVEDGQLPNRTWARRMGEQDLVGALDGWQTKGEGGPGRKGTVAYVCGTPPMTDSIAEFLGRQEGMSAERVLCEKWW